MRPRHLRRTYDAPAKEALERSRALRPGRAGCPAAHRAPLSADAGGVRSLGPPRGAAPRHRKGCRGGSSSRGAPRAAVRRGAGPEGHHPGPGRTCYLVAGIPRSASRCLGSRRKHPDVPVLVRGESVPDEAFWSTHSPRSSAAGRGELRRADRLGLETRDLDNARFPIKGADLPPLGSQAKWIFALEEGISTESRRRSRQRPVACSPATRRLPRRDDLRASRAGDRGPERSTARGAGSQRPASWIGGIPAGGGFADYGCTGRSPRTFPSPSTAQRSGERTSSSASTARAESVRRGRDPRVRAQPPRRLRLRDGKARWSVGQETVERSPCIVSPSRRLPSWRAGLVCPAIRGDDCYAAGVTPQGNVLWVRRLYSYSPSYYERYGSSSRTARPWRRRTVSSRSRTATGSLVCSRPLPATCAGFPGTSRRSGRGTTTTVLRGARLRSS